jgi:hypothetical protein
MIKLIPADTICCDSCDEPIMTVDQQFYDDCEAGPPPCEGIIKRKMKSKMRAVRDPCSVKHLCERCATEVLKWTWTEHTATRARSLELAQEKIRLCPRCALNYRPQTWTSRHEKERYEKEQRAMQQPSCHTKS